MPVKKSKIMQALAMISILLTTACSSLPNRQSIAVDEYKMAHAVQGHGTPVVVFESGFGAPMENWSKVFSEVASFSTAFAYNRRGYDGSEPYSAAAEDSTFKEIARAIGDLTLEAGFNSKSAFYTAFKKHTDVTPSQFRQSLPDTVEP